jgi:hypothetical protein
MQTASTALTATAGSTTTVTADQASTFLHTLQQRKQLRPACMSMAVIAQGADLAVDEEQANSLPVLQVRTMESMQARQQAICHSYNPLLQTTLACKHAQPAAYLPFCLACVTRCRRSALMRCHP